LLGALSVTLVAVIPAIAFTGAVGIAIAVSEAARIEATREADQLAQRLRVPVTSVDCLDPTHIGVDRAVQDILPGDGVPEYVARTIDGALARALSAAMARSGPWLIVVMGPSKVGKSRALYEGLKCVDVQSPLQVVAPVDSDSLRSLVAPETRLQIPSSSSVALWLDDIEPFIGNGTNLMLLRRWHAAFGGVVVATYGGKGSETLVESNAAVVVSTASEVLQAAAQIHLGAATRPELQAVPHLMSHEVVEVLIRHGLAAYLVAAPALERKLATHRHAPGSPVCPEGVAVVRATADWVRCGRTDPIPDEVLRQLWTQYLPGHITPTDEGFIRGLEWALRPVAGNIALIERVHSYVAYDYVLRLILEGVPDGPPPAMWEAARATASPVQALTVGYAAFVAGNLAEAESALALAAASAEPAVAIPAMYNRAIALTSLGRVTEADAIYHRLEAELAATDQPELIGVLALLRFNRANLAADQGRFDDALTDLAAVTELYVPAIEPWVGVVAARAYLNIGAILDRLERYAEAEVARRTVEATFAASESPVMQAHVAKAMWDRGTGLELQERYVEAAAVYREVVDRYDEADPVIFGPIVAMGLVNLSNALSRIGPPADALAVADEVLRRFGDDVQGPFDEAIARALVNRAVLLRRLDRVDDARAADSDVIDRFSSAGSPLVIEQVARALVNEAVGVTDDATEAAVGLYSRAVALLEPLDGVEQTLGKALIGRGQLLWKTGDQASAQTDFEKALRRLEPLPAIAARRLAAEAAASLGSILAAMSRYEDAVIRFGSTVREFGGIDDAAIQFTVAECLVGEAVALAKLGRSNEAVERDREIVSRFASHQEPRLRAHAVGALADASGLLSDAGRYDDALQALDEALSRFSHDDASGVAERLAHVRVDRGVVLARAGRLAEAIRVFDESIASAAVSQNLSAAANAWYNKGLALVDRGDFQDAVAVLAEFYRRFGSTNDETRHGRLASALSMTATAWSELGRLDEADMARDTLVRRFLTSPDAAIQVLVARGLADQGLLRIERQDEAEALSVLDRAVRQFGASSDPAVRAWVAWARVFRGFALSHIGRETESTSEFELVVATYGDDDDQTARQAVDAARGALDA
jgi:tetratricopeptide (TPR) repeat protein